MEMEKYCEGDFRGTEGGRAGRSITHPSQNRKGWGARLAWLKKDGQGYQTRVNRMLRERMLKDLEGR